MRLLLQVYRDQFIAEPMQSAMGWLGVIWLGYMLWIGVYAFATYQPTGDGRSEYCHVDRMSGIETCGYSR